MNPEEYISKRILNTCLKEDVRGIVSLGIVTNEVEEAVTKGWHHDRPKAWLVISHLSPFTVYLPLTDGDCIQRWCAAETSWLFASPINNQIKEANGYIAWLDLLSSGLSEVQKRNYDLFKQEAKTAELHCELSNSAKSILKKDISFNEKWYETLVVSEQIAAFGDHPYYPTAKAKVGFDKKEYRQYSPDFANQFKLRWLAVPMQDAQITSEQPSCWPSFDDLGFDGSLSENHTLFPIHPITVKQLVALPENYYLSEQAYLTVIPTLSMRTVALVDFPDIHIKLPIAIGTLGRKNLRLIKSGTIYDGHWFESLLNTILRVDEILAPLALHVNEQHGAYCISNKNIAYIVRKYPEFSNKVTIFSIAALCSDRHYLFHLINHFYSGSVKQWVDDPRSQQ